MYQREVVLRRKVEALEKAIAQQMARIEIERALERGKARRSLARSAEVDALWDAARKALYAAIAAEDKIIQDLVELGYGKSEPTVTAPFWLNRQLFLEEWKASQG